MPAAADASTRYDDRAQPERHRLLAVGCCPCASPQGGCGCALGASAGVPSSWGQHHHGRSKHRSRIATAAVCALLRIACGACHTDVIIGSHMHEPADSRGTMLGGAQHRRRGALLGAECCCRGIRPHGCGVALAAEPRPGRGWDSGPCDRRGCWRALGAVPLRRAHGRWTQHSGLVGRAVHSASSFRCRRIGCGGGECGR